MHRKEVTHPMASNRKKSRSRIWLTKWDKVKAHDTLIDWCTGREWPLKYMTVISAWWRSNMPFQRLSGWLSGRLNYYITRWDELESDELEISRVETRCGRESHHPAEGALGTPDGVWGPDQLVIRCSRESQQSGSPGLRLSSHGDMSREAGEVNMLQSLFGLQLLLTRKPYYKVRGIFF